ncbi:lysosomal acid glucosylceramidase-like [Anticarsia gemmatalis]|uniref:lysosomal acid glucosylceramidase-like n=1 Tax=Anticarsia gemmatalis TaxID=129554 RepID=UPI003F770BF8
MATSTKWVWVATLAILCSFLAVGFSEEDVPCLARDVGIPGRSIVCVCNATYCDTITREDPEPGTYVVYTSSNAGQRFEKSWGVIRSDTDPPPTEPTSPTTPEPTTPEPTTPEPTTPEPTTPEPTTPDPTTPEQTTDVTAPPNIENEEEEEMDVEEIPEERAVYEDESDNGGSPILDNLLNNVAMRVFPSTRRQFIEGFGGSVTDAASINWRKLTDETQQKFIDSYFGAKGLEYNLIRVPIGGCDFSEHAYTYNEEPWYDHALSNFSLTSEDYFYKLPMIKRSQQVATDEIKITASTWSPPIWMKTNERITGFGQLKPEFYQSYADYHVRFMEEYEKAEVKIWAITTTNEPINGIVPLARFNSLGWTPSQLGKWVADNLGPTIRGSKYNKTLIFAVDDQRYVIPTWLRGMEKEDPKSIEYIDGIAIHYYGNFIPPSILSRVQERYPNKILLSTEACEGPMPWDLLKVEIGSWRRARRYVTSILEDLNNYVVGWIDWNLCLDPGGGPNWANNFVDAPILVYGEDDEFIKQPMFYAMGHFSKFIPRGARVIRVSRRSVLSLENIATLKTNGNIVMVLQNRRSREMNVKINISARRFIEFKMEAQSIKTIEINPN